MLKCALLALLVISTGLRAGAEEPTTSGLDLDTFLADWSKHSGELKTLEIQFRQEKRLKLLRKPLVSSGTVRLAGGKLECVVRDKSGKTDSVLFVEKNSMRILYPRLKRLEIYDLASTSAPAMAFPIFGSDPAKLKRDYDIQLAEDGERRKLTLTPRDKDAPVGAMTLIFKDLEIQEVEQTDRRGDRVRMIIERFDRNPEMDASKLELEIPPGTKTERPLAKKTARERRNDD
jgi:outer membrane lipoprotein-sorting protein